MKRSDGHMVQEIYCEDCVYFKKSSLSPYGEYCLPNTKKIKIPANYYHRDKTETIKVPFTPEKQNKNNDCRYIKLPFFSRIINQIC